MLAPWKKSYDKSRQHIKKQRYYFADKGPSSQSYDFSSSHVWMWELDHREGWMQKNWCFWTVVLEKTLESSLDCKENKPSILKEINTEYSLEKQMLKLKLQYFSHLMSWLTGKDLDAGKDWRQEDKGTTKDGMVGWHHWLNGHEFEQAPGDGEGQGILVCCSPWRRKELDTPEWLKTSKITQLSECKGPNWNWGGLIPLAWINASWVWESRGVNVKFLFPGKVYTSVTR